MKDACVRLDMRSEVSMGGSGLTAEDPEFGSASSQRHQGSFRHCMSVKSGHLDELFCTQG